EVQGLEHDLRPGAHRVRQAGLPHADRHVHREVQAEELLEPAVRRADARLGVLHLAGPRVPLRPRAGGPARVRSPDQGPGAQVLLPPSGRRQDPDRALSAAGSGAPHTSGNRARERRPRSATLGLSPSPPFSGVRVARVVVDVIPKPEILDPQGQAIVKALPRLGFTGVKDVRQGKHFELEVDDEVDDATLAKIAESFLSNPVIEDYVVRRVESWRSASSRPPARWTTSTQPARPVRSARRPCRCGTPTTTCGVWTPWSCLAAFPTVTTCAPARSHASRQSCSPWWTRPVAGCRCSVSATASRSC